MGVLRLVLLRLCVAMLGALLLCGSSQTANARMQADNSELDQSSFDDAYENYLSDNELQRERPIFELYLPDIKLKPKKNTWKFPVWLIDFFSGLGGLIQLIFWAVIGLTVLAILYFLFTQLRRTQLRRNKEKKKKEKPEDDIYVDIRPDKKAALTLLEEADKLAKSGQFAEAVHLLLFRSIDDIQERLEGGVPKSLTSREIGSLDTIPDRAKSALNPIIQIVERSFFGDAPVTIDDWKTARKAYETFAFGEDWS